MYLMDGSGAPSESTWETLGLHCRQLRDTKSGQGAVCLLFHSALEKVGCVLELYYMFILESCFKWFPKSKIPASTSSPFLRDITDQGTHFCGGNGFGVCPSGWDPCRAVPGLVAHRETLLAHLSLRVSHLHTLPNPSSIPGSPCSADLQGFAMKFFRYKSLLVLQILGNLVWKTSA